MTAALARERADASSSQHGEPADGSLIQAMLDAMDGVAYIADETGQIIAGRRSDHAAHGPTPGQNLFALMAGDEVSAAYRTLQDRVLSGASSVVTFEYRCDAPDIKRRMRMAMSRLEALGRRLVLYQSQMITAVERPWMTLFEPARILERLREDSRLPIVRMCSFCHKVARAEDGGMTPSWCDPEVYYARGGAADVRISHGVCPGCEDSLAVGSEPL